MSAGRLLLLLVLGCAIAAPAPAETAREILDELRRVNRAREPKDVKQILKMTQYRSQAVEFVREVETRLKLYPDGSAKTVVFFLSPVDIKGVGFLSWNDPHKPDVQWLYLPKTHRVRQLGPAMRRQSFQGTVFTYEDMELFQEMARWGDADVTSRLVRADEVEEGSPCALIELIPKRDEISYGRFLLWIHRPDWTLRRADLFDRADGELVKTASFRRFTTIDGRPVAGETDMVNVRSGLRTLLEVIETRFDQGFDEEMFTPWYMERAAR